MPTWDKSNGTICQTEVDIQSFEANDDRLLGKHCIFFRFFGKLKVLSHGKKRLHKELRAKDLKNKKRKPGGKVSAGVNTA